MIGLLCLLIPLVFTLVSKKLDAAGKQGDEAKAPSMPEVAPSIKKFEPEKEAAPAIKPNSKAASKSAAKQAAKPVDQPVKGKIDPKKLVIYSEIMKPKF